MNSRFYTIVLLLAATILLSFGCGQNQQAASKTVTNQDGIQLPVVSKTVYTNLSLPAWLFTLPEGDYAIGIASESIKNKSSQINTAKEFAAFTLAQNAGSFRLEKTEIVNQNAQLNNEQKITESYEILGIDSAKQNINSNQLQPLAEAKVKGYKLYLMGTGNPTLNNDLIKVSASTSPKWCRTLEVTEDEQYYYIVGKAVDAKLNIAWNNAQGNALIKLAQYRLEESLKSKKVSNDQTQKAAQLDSVKREFNATLAQTWFYHKTENTAPVFNVFLQLKVKK